MVHSEAFHLNNPLWGQGINPKKSLPSLSGERKKQGDWGMRDVLKQVSLQPGLSSMQQLTPVSSWNIKEDLGWGSCRASSYLTYAKQPESDQSGRKYFSRSFWRSPGAGRGPAGLQCPLMLSSFIKVCLTHGVKTGFVQPNAGPSPWRRKHLHDRKDGGRYLWEAMVAMFPTCKQITGRNTKVMFVNHTLSFPLPNKKVWSCSKKVFISRS